MSFGETFLQYPELFPGRRSGEACGEREVVLDFAGGPYLFQGLNKAQALAIHERFGDLCRAREEAGPITVETALFHVADGEFRKFNLKGWEYTLDMEYEPTSVRVAGLHIMALLDWDSELRGALWTSEKDGDDFRGVFENYFRMLVAYRLLECGGVLLHSAGVIDGDHAYLFFGQSGAGKSTISRFCINSGRAVLSDDLNALCQKNGIAVVEKMPFAGDLGQTSTRSASYPVRAICRLQKGGANTIQPIGKAQAVGALITCAPYVNADPHRQSRLVANLESLVRAVPVQRLTFSLNARFGDILGNINQEVMQ